MPASRTLVAISAVVIALLGCGSGKDQAAPANALSLGLPGLPAPSDSANWTLGGVPCTLIPVPAAAPLGSGTCSGVRPGAIELTDVGQCTSNFIFQEFEGMRSNCNA